jgi:Mor family transcriptional regulator
MPYPRFLSHGDRAHRREKIVSAFETGLPPVKLAKRFAVTEGHVRRVLRETGAAEPGRPWAYRERRGRSA